MLSDLLLLSGNDIPFPEAQLTIHQPTIKEIAYIGEEAFFSGCGLLDFSKDLLDEEDKVRLSNYNDFDIFMSIIIKPDKKIQSTIDNAFLVLALIFPLYSIEVRVDAIVLKKENEEKYINKVNFVAFQQIISSMFGLKLGGGGREYNPQGDLASKIAEKLKRRHQQLMKVAKGAPGEESRISILNRYVSILAVGTQKTINDLMNYTVWQLFDEFQRFQLKMQWDAYIQARMAGAQDLEEVDNWMIDLQDQGKNKNKK